MPPAAIIAGGAVLGGIGTAVAASKNASAIKSSADSSLQAQRESIAAQERAFQQQLAAQKDALSQGLNLQTNALNQNTALQADQYNSSGRLQTDIYNQNVNTLNPFVQTGYSAMNGINALVGLPQQQGYTPQNVSFTPVKAQQIAVPTPAPAPAPSSPTQAPPIAQAANPHADYSIAQTTTGAISPQQYSAYYARRFG